MPDVVTFIRGIVISRIVVVEGYGHLAESEGPESGAEKKIANIMENHAFFFYKIHGVP